MKKNRFDHSWATVLLEQIMLKQSHHHQHADGFVLMLAWSNAYKVLNIYICKCWCALCIVLIICLWAHWCLQATFLAKWLCMRDNLKNKKTLCFVHDANYFCDLNSHLNCNGRSTPTLPSGWTLYTTVSKMLQVSVKMLRAGVQTEYPQSDSSLCKS